ncbi:mediator of RNA polymerase II transcription subunit 8 [Lunasporangiospora selenospora]|uniref:Mediator of RNA polymerase II transcription subunit 8 n=1 Tax=Lunasporangiospora selenospora TaxID=979761 RepID=A0A9P6KIY9_9FUNG|nr:mediator of RNA polymerase II transcription subunit 8 [Lunasporangiospora selenospora]
MSLMMNPFPQSEISIDTLESVKARLQQLQESILHFLRSINPESTPSTASWTELHSKFNVLIARYLNLANILNSPHSSRLQSYTVFPNEPPATDQNVQNLSVLLRTKLFPELEQDDEDRIAQGAALLGLPTGSGGTPVDERRTLAALKLKVMLHDALCKAADEIFEGQLDQVNTRMRFEADVEDDLNSPASKATPSTNDQPTTTIASRPISDDNFFQNDLQLLGIINGQQANIQYVDDWGRDRSSIVPGLKGSLSVAGDETIHNAATITDGVNALSDTLFDENQSELEDVYERLDREISARQALMNSGGIDDFSDMDDTDSLVEEEYEEEEEKEIKKDSRTDEPLDTFTGPAAPGHGDNDDGVADGDTFMEVDTKDGDALDNIDQSSQMALNSKVDFNNGDEDNASSADDDEGDMEEVV